MLITVLVVSSLFIVGRVFAESYPKTSVPEFTLELVDTTLDLKIKNQPLVSLYNVRVKLHSSEQWNELFGPRRGDGEPNYASPSDSEFTVIIVGTLFPPSGNDGPTSYLNIWSNTGNFEGLEVPSGEQVDFQVEAMIGYFALQPVMPAQYYAFSGEKSGWSETQTLTVPVLSPTPLPLDEALKTMAPVLGVTVTVLVLSLIGIGLRRHNKPKQIQTQLGYWQ
jgi:hypothetical protein